MFFALSLCYTLGTTPVSSPLQLVKSLSLEVITVNENFAFEVSWSLPKMFLIYFNNNLTLQLTRTFSRIISLHTIATLQSQYMTILHLSTDLLVPVMSISQKHHCIYSDTFLVGLGLYKCRSQGPHGLWRFKFGMDVHWTCRSVCVDYFLSSKGLALNILCHSGSVSLSFQVMLHFGLLKLNHNHRPYPCMLKVD